MHGMKLVEGQGNEYQGGRPLEDDRFNTVYVLGCCLPLLLLSWERSCHVQGACDEVTCSLEFVHWPAMCAHLYIQCIQATVALNRTAGMHAYCLALDIAW